MFVVINSFTEICLFVFTASTCYKDFMESMRQLKDVSCCCLFGFNVAFNNFSVISNWTPEKNAVINLKLEHLRSSCRVMDPNNTDRMANSVDPDQTAPK